MLCWIGLFIGLLDSSLGCSVSSHHASPNEVVLKKKEETSHGQTRNDQVKRFPPHQNPHAKPQTHIQSLTTHTNTYKTPSKLHKSFRISHDHSPNKLFETKTVTVHANPKNSHGFGFPQLGFLIHVLIQSMHELSTASPRIRRWRAPLTLVRNGETKRKKLELATVTETPIHSSDS